MGSILMELAWEIINEAAAALPVQTSPAIGSNGDEGVAYSGDGSVFLEGNEGCAHPGDGGVYIGECAVDPNNW
jgi:hypothetical protein